MLPVISGAAAIVVLILLIVKLKLHPFSALMISSIILGLVNGLGSTKSVSTFTKGFGDQLSVSGVVIGLGAIIGGLLVSSGGGTKIADIIIGKSKKALIPMAIGLVALIIELPNLFEVTFVLMVPIVFSVAKSLGKSPLYVAIPMAAGMMTAHGLLPPGPATIIGGTALGADLGMVTALGLIIAVPVFASGVWLFPKLMQKQYLTYAVNDGSEFDQSATAGEDRSPSLAAALTSVLLAPAMMVIGTLGDAVFPKSSIAWTVTHFMGNAVISLLIAALFSMVFLGLRLGMSGNKVLGLSKTSLKPIVNVLLIIGAGGGLKAMLEGVGLSKIIATTTAEWAIPMVLLAWLIAALFRIALGSGTVAVTAAAGIVAPMLAQSDSVHKAMMVLAICTGSMIFSHVNDGAFWLFQEYFGMTVPQTLKTWSLLVTIQSVVGLLGLLAMEGVISLV